MSDLSLQENWTKFPEALMSTQPGCLLKYNRTTVLCIKFKSYSSPLLYRVTVTYELNCE